MSTDIKGMESSLEPKSNLLSRLSIGTICSVLVGLLSPSLYEPLLSPILGEEIYTSNPEIITILFSGIIMVIIFLVVSIVSRKKDVQIPQEINQKLLKQQGDEAVFRAKNQRLQYEIQQLEEKLAELDKDTESELKKKNEIYRKQMETILFESEQELESINSKLEEQRAKLDSYMQEIDQEQEQTQRLKGDHQQLNTKINQTRNNIKTMLVRSNETIEQKQAEIQKIKQENQKKLSEKLSDLENSWKQKSAEIQKQKAEELKKLEEKLANEEKRREILEEKRRLEEAKIKLQEKLEKERFEELDLAKSKIEKIKENLLKLKSQASTTQEATVNEKFEAMLKKIDESILKIGQQKHNIHTKGVLSSSLQLINKQIHKLRNSINLQRAAPVLFVSAEPEKTFFNKINKITYLCECCFQPVCEVEFKKRRTWTKYGILGLKVLVGVALNKGVSALSSAIASQMGDQNILDDVFESYADKLGGMWEDSIEKKELKDQETAYGEYEDSLKEIESVFGEDGKTLAKSLKMTALYFQYEIKESNLDTIEEYTDLREKDIWESFTRNEQEEIRKMLKSTDNSQVYSSEFTLKNGLFMCKDCVDWLDSVESENKYL